MPGRNRRWLHEVSGLFSVSVEKQPGQLHAREKCAARKEGVCSKKEMTGGRGPSA
jgi:hypothetical protein